MKGTRFAAFQSFETLEVRRLFAADLLSDAAGLSAAPTVTIDGVKGRIWPTMCCCRSATRFAKADNQICGVVWGSR